MRGLELDWQAHAAGQPQVAAGGALMFFGFILPPSGCPILRFFLSKGGLGRTRIIGQVAQAMFLKS